MGIEEKMNHSNTIPETPGRLLMKYGILGHCKSLKPDVEIKLLYKYNSEKDFTKKEMEKIFPNAIPRIKEWSVEGVREYFIKEHNKYAKQESCKVGVYSIIKTKKIIGGSIVSVLCDKKELSFFNEYELNLKKGDKISTHLGIVVEKLPKNYR